MKRTVMLQPARRRVTQYKGYRVSSARSRTYARLQEKRPTQKKLSVRDSLAGALFIIFAGVCMLAIIAPSHSIDILLPLITAAFTLILQYYFSRQKKG